VDGNGSELLPAVTVDAQGNTLAMWVTLSAGGATSEIWASRSAPGKAWATPTRLDTTDGTLDMTGPGSNPPQLVGTADGHAVALWEQFSPAAGGFALWARPFDPASGWGTPAQVVPNLTSAVYTAGIDAQGNTLVAWEQKTAVANSQIAASRYTPGGTWSAPQLIPVPAQTGPGAIPGSGGGDGIFNVTPNLAMNAAGNAVVAWRQTDLTHSNLWTASYDPSNGWTNSAPAVIVVDNTKQQVFAPVVGIDGKANVTLAWGEADFDNAGSHTTTMSQRYVPGTGWQSAQAVTAPVSDSSSVVYTPVVAVNDQGIAAVTWMRPDDTLQASVADASGAWGPVQQMTAHVYLLDNRAPQLALDGAGNATVAWEDSGTTGSTDIFTNRYAGGAWGTATLLGTEPQDAQSPALAVNASGITALVWSLFKDLTVGDVLEASLYTPAS
jgi:hypothetical protein